LAIAVVGLGGQQPRHATIKRTLTQGVAAEGQDEVKKIAQSGKKKLKLK